MKKCGTTYPWTVGIALTLVSVCTVHAEEKNLLTAAEITKTLSGNTLSGVFGEQKTRYAQRIHESGIAVVHVEGSPVRLIPWFVKEPNSYCEDWDKDGVPCYQIGQEITSGDHYFVYPDGSTSDTITVQEGFHPITFK